MKIRQSDIGRFQSAEQAQAYNEAMKVRSEVLEISNDCIQVDNLAIDDNGDRGLVVLNHKDLTALNGRECRQWAMIPMAEGRGIPVDPVYLTEQDITGECSYNLLSKSKELTSLHMSCSGHPRGAEYEFHQKGSFLGLTSEKDVYRKTTLLPNDHHFTKEVHIDRKTGTIDYSEYRQ